MQDTIVPTDQPGISALVAFVADATASGDLLVSSARFVDALLDARAEVEPDVLRVVDEALTASAHRQVVPTPEAVELVAAITAAVLACAGTGDRVVLPSDGYYTTRLLAAEELARFGIAVDYVVPKPVMFSGFAAGIMKNAPNPEGAKAFLNWLIGKEFLSYRQERYGNLTLNTDVPSKDITADDIAKMDKIDYEHVNAQRTAWIDRFERDVTAAIPTGATVEVDPAAGTVRLISTAPRSP